MASAKVVPISVYVKPRSIQRLAANFDLMLMWQTGPKSAVTPQKLNRQFTGGERQLTALHEVKFQIDSPTCYAECVQLDSKPAS